MDLRVEGRRRVDWEEDLMSWDGEEKEDCEMCRVGVEVG